VRRITLGVAGALWSSSSAMVAVISTLNRAFDIDCRPWWKIRPSRSETA
jgi:membrane protein